MTRAEFESRRKEDWDRLAAILDALDTRRKRKKIPAGELAALPVLYRAASEDLALTRHRGYGLDLAESLNQLCLRAYHHLHGAKSGIPRRVLRFLAVGFPQLVRAEAGVSLAAIGLFFGPFILMILAGFMAPEWVFAALPDDMRVQLEGSFSTDAESAEFARDVESDVMMFGQYVRNNVGIAFRTFAGGILLCIGSIFFLAYNGIVLGAAFGYSFMAGFERTFMAFTSGHGAPELIGIALSGAAGLRLGLAILKPGRRTRALALQQDGRRAVRLALGSGALITFAALIEAFWSANAFPVEVKYTFGAVMWLGVIAWLLFAGKGRRASTGRHAA